MADQSVVHTRALDPARTGVAIDAADTVDRDDAVWVEPAGTGGWRVWVHIADVARAVPAGSEVDQEALRRGATRYLPDRTIGMLPAPVERQAALAAGRQLPTAVVELSLDAAGDVVDTTVRAGELQRVFAISHAQAAAAITDADHVLHPMLVRAHTLAGILLARRRAAGALALYDLRTGIATSEEGTLVRMAAAQRNTAYILVQELMVATNTAVAAWCAEREVPILFRNHRASTVAGSREDLLDDLVAAAGGDPARRAVAQQRLTMMLRPATYDAHVGGHFGLNLAAYTHVTSPIRRYPDLVNQRILLALAAGRPHPYPAAALAEIAAVVNHGAQARRTAKATAFKTRAQRAVRRQLAEQDYQGIDDDAFGKILKLAVTEGRLTDALAGEADRRATAGRLLPRDAATILFGLADHPVKQTVLRWLAGEPAHAISLLSLYTQTRQTGPLEWTEHSVGTVGRPLFRVTVQLAVDDTIHRSAARTAGAKGTARAQAALSLVAALSGLPDISREPTTPPAASAPPRHPATGHHPVMQINELAQTGRLADVAWSYRRSGPDHQPVFECVVTATAAGRTLRGHGTGITKADAKTRAAAALHDALGEPAGRPNRPTLGTDTRPATPSPAVATGPANSPARAPHLPDADRIVNALRWCRHTPAQARLARGRISALTHQIASLLATGWTPDEVRQALDTVADQTNLASDPMRQEKLWRQALQAHRKIRTPPRPHDHTGSAPTRTD